MPSVAPPAFRVFHHPGGREWQVREVGAEVQIAFVVDGERIERVRKFPNRTAARQALEELVRDQNADGFVETAPQAPPPWQAFLDALVTRWHAASPAFDADALRAAVLALTKPLPDEVVEAAMRLGDDSPPSVGDPPRRYRVGVTKDGLAAVWLGEHFPATLPMMILALRHPNPNAHESVDQMLAGETAALPALFCVTEFSERANTHVRSGYRGLRHSRRRARTNAGAPRRAFRATRGESRPSGARAAGRRTCHAARA